MLAVLIPLYILITFGIGFWASTKVKTTEDFTLAGKSLSTSFIGVTLFATWFGSSQIMGNPGYFVEEGIVSFMTLAVSGVV
jgi:Na+/proline symporter